MLQTVDPVRAILSHEQKLDTFSSWTVTMILILLAVFFVFCDLCYCIPLPNDKNIYYIKSKLGMNFDIVKYS